MFQHIPVLRDEVIQALSPKSKKIYVDCTFGAGGHSRAIIESAPECFLYSIDRDILAMTIWEKEFCSHAHNMKFINDKFSNALLGAIPTGVDGILIDLGISSIQLDNPERGFSFMREGKLCMRMGGDGISAYDIINNETEEELARILFYYADETKSRQIARSIVKKRSIKPIETTIELADAIRFALRSKKRHKIDPATKAFMAIRMCVNNELEELAKAMNYGLNLLNIGGKMLIISFNSSEDKIIKIILEELSRTFNGEGILETEVRGKFRAIGSKIRPTPEEIDANPRARSAGMRIIERLE